MKNNIICIAFTLFSVLFNFSSSSPSAIEYGVLASESSTDKENFCIIYFKEFSTLPETKSEADFHLLQDESDIDWCEEHPKSDIKSKVLLLTNGNCSISTQARNIYDRGGEGILFITPRGKVSGVNVNATAAEGINMSVALISERSAEKLKKMHPRVSVCLFAPIDVGFDFSLLVIFIVAVLTVIIGSYWSGLLRFAIYCKEINSLPGGTHELPNEPSVAVNTSEESSINVSPFAVAGFVLCMGLMLVLLYFFFSYLIYFIIGLFVLASILSIHCCLEPLVLKIQLGFCKAQFRCGTRSYNIDFRQVLLVAFSIAVSIYWLVIRKEKYAWILQDILGIAFCINMLKSIRLPSFKICAILLVLLFVYDIFFVFITPFITGKAESVMEEVATGGKSDEMVSETEKHLMEKTHMREEQVPMVLRVPHLGFDSLSVCNQQFSILGFGDILVPGLLVSYCHGFDLVTNKKKIYFLTTIIAYGIGLLITFVGLFLMNTAQPALLYLVPCTLLPPVIIAWYRKELSELWTGFRVIKPSRDLVYPEVQVAENVSSAEVHQESTTLPSSNDVINPSEGAGDIHNERNHLLR